MPRCWSTAVSHCAARAAALALGLLALVEPMQGLAQAPAAEGQARAAGTRAGAVGAGGAAARAPAPDTSGWACRLCRFEQDNETEITPAASYVSDDAAHFGDATGYDEAGGYLNLDAGGASYSQDLRIRWELEDLGLDSRRLIFVVGHPGAYEYYIGYDAIPRREFDTTRTVFAPTATDTLTLPGDWVRAGQTGGFTALDANLADRDIGSDRETTRVGGRYALAERFDAFVDYRRSKQDGVDVQGASYYTSASLLPRPFDYETSEVDAGIRYANERSNLEVAYYGSFFDDRNTALNWQNPFLGAPGAEVGALAQPPDSNFQQLRLSGGYRMRWHGTVVTYSLASGLMEQDDALLAYTTNPNIIATPLPRSSLDGRVETTNLAVAATATPIARGRVSLSYRYDDRDNETPIEQWRRVVVDTFDSGDVETNAPYSFERNRFKLGGDFAILPTLKLSGEYELERTERSLQEVGAQDRAASSAQLRWRPSDTLDFKGRVGTEERDPDRYDAALAASLGQNPLMRKYDLAYRWRVFGEFTVSAALPNKPISVTGTALLANDDYTQSLLGLLASDERRFAADLTWSPSEHASLYLTAAFDSVDSSQAGSEFFATPDWRASIADDFTTFGAGGRLQQIKERFELDVDFTHGTGRSEIDVLAASGGASGFPALGSDLDALRLRLRYRANERLHANLELRFERFEADDWGLEGVGPATIPNVLSLGANPYDYDVFLIGFGVTYALSGGEGGAN